MATQPYFLNGVRVPGVTTVLGGNLGWSKDALMAWSNREGLAGRNIRDRGPKEIAADVGTAAHSMMEDFVQGADPYAGTLLLALTAEEQEQSCSAFRAFLRWKKNNRLNIVATEAYLVDEEQETGGCIDALALDESETWPILDLVDYKTGKGVYAEAVCQVAAYTVFMERLLSKAWGTVVTLGGAHILRVRAGVFVHRYWPRSMLTMPYNAFTWARALHAVRWDIERMVK
jgi:hypothetical protein